MWFPDSAFKTAQALKDFNRGDLDLRFACWGLYIGIIFPWSLQTTRKLSLWVVGVEGFEKGLGPVGVSFIWFVV